MTKTKLFIGLLIAITLTFSLTSNNAYANTPNPNTLTTVAISSTQIDLTWNAGTGTGGHVQLVFRCTGSACTPISIVSPFLSGGTTTFSDTGLTPSTEYGYRVVSFHGFTTGSTNISYATTSTIVDTTPPVITLLGSNPQTIIITDSYTELGATALDDIDGDITANIIIDSSAVDVNLVGSYQVTYDVMDSAGNNAVQVTRTVDVIDTIIPVITLLGDQIVNIPYGFNYIDAGATAQDINDGDITANIVTTGLPINTLVSLAVYTVTYDVMDSSGNNAIQVTRTINIGAKGNSNCNDCQAPSIGITSNGARVVDGGITVNGVTTNADFFFTPFKLIQSDIGEPIDFVFKIWDDRSDSITHVQLQLGKEKIGEPFTSIGSVTWDRTFNNIESVTHDEMFTDVIIERLPDESCKPSTVDCTVIHMNITPTKAIVGDVVFGLNIWDFSRNSLTTFFNEGYQVGTIDDVIIEPEWIVPQGEGNKPNYIDDSYHNVMTRTSPNFDLVKAYELSRAEQTIKSLYPKLFEEPTHSETNNSQ